MKNFLAFVIILLAFMPLILVFNANPETIYYNFIGIAYAYALCKWGRKLAPKFVIDFLKTDDDL